MISAYFVFKLSQLKKTLVSFVSFFTEPAAYFYVWAGIAIGILLMNYFGLANFHFVYLVVPFVAIVCIWAYVDYQKGEHVRWQRDKKGIPSPQAIKALKAMYKNKERKDVPEEGAESRGAENNNRD